MQSALLQSALLQGALLQSALLQGAATEPQVRQAAVACFVELTLQGTHRGEEARMIGEGSDALLLQVDRHLDLRIPLGLRPLQPRLQGRDLHPRMASVLRQLALSSERGSMRFVHRAARLDAGPGRTHVVQHRGGALTAL